MEFIIEIFVGRVASTCSNFNSNGPTDVVVIVLRVVVRAIAASVLARYAAVQLIALHCSH